MDSPDPLDEDLKDEVGLDELSLSMPQSGQGGEDLAEQLAEFQTMMLELKDGFVHAMEELSKVQNGDTAVQEHYEAAKVEQERQLQEIKDMVNSLKEQFQSVSTQVLTASDNQNHLRNQVDKLQQEREVLLQELERSGAISNQLRQRFLNGNHTSDANHVTSDHDSGVATTYRPDISSHGDATPPMISPMVRPFIAGLQNANRPEDNFDENYDSDSSLIEAANKSLNLSRSLGQKCLDVDPSNSSDGSDNEKENISSTQGFPSPMSRHKSSFSPKKLPPHELSIRETQRSRVARELLETERKYCTSLWTIVDTYCQPIKQAGCIGGKDISLMFPSSVSRLYSLHCNMLHKLEEKLLNWKWQCGIGDIFSRFTETNSEILGTYKIYVHDFPTAIGTINKWFRQSSRFRKVLKTCQKQPSCEGLDLTAFLLTPIQRIPRYVLLLKQLRKYTDPEHPDYYYLESALDCLGHFLSQLNNSIEHSMQLVGLDGGGGKQQRKQRNATSLRRSSSSSHDGLQYSSTTRDSGIHSMADSHGGRRYQLSVFKNPSKQIGHHSDSSDFAMDPHSIPMPRDKHKSSHYMNGGPVGRDSTFSHEGQNYIKNKNRDKPRKSKSKKGHRNELTMEALSTGNGARFTGEGEDYRDRNRRKNPRSKSMAEHISETSYRNRIDEGYDDSGEAGMIRKNSHRSKSSTRPASDYLSISMRDLVGEGSDESLDMEKMAPDGASFHRSLPRLPKDYGIYGEDDSVVDEPTYMPSMASKDVPTRKAQKLGLVQKSKSHGDFLQQEGAASPSQSHLNIVLARSLTDAHVNNIGESGIITDGEASPTPLRKHMMQANRNSMVATHQEFPDRVRENVWNDDLEQSYIPRDSSVAKEEKSRRKKLKEKRKDRHKQVVENLASRPTSGGGGLKKKRSLRDSLRNIFFRKRGNSSKVMEMDPNDQTGELSYLDQSGSMEQLENAENYEFSRTFEDENGDPCSAV